LEKGFAFTHKQLAERFGWKDEVRARQLSAFLDWLAERVEVPSAGMSKACLYAAIGGDRDPVRWLLSRGVVFDESARRNAGQCGHLDVVRVLCGTGPVPIDDNDKAMFLEAMYRDHAHVVAWAIDELGWRPSRAEILCMKAWNCPRVKRLLALRGFSMATGWPPVRTVGDATEERSES